jgi:hypothetical protein
MQHSKLGKMTEILKDESIALIPDHEKMVTTATNIS